MATQAEIEEARHSANKLGAFVEQFARARRVLDVSLELEHQIAAAATRRDVANSEAQRAVSELAELRASIAAARTECDAGAEAFEAQKRAAAAAVSKADAQLREIGSQVDDKRRELAVFEQKLSRAKAEARALLFDDGASASKQGAHS